MSAIFRHVQLGNNNAQKPKGRKKTKSNNNNARRESITKFQKDKRQANLNAKRKGSNPKAAMKAVAKPKLGKVAKKNSKSPAKRPTKAAANNNKKKTNKENTKRTGNKQSAKSKKVVLAGQKKGNKNATAKKKKNDNGKQLKKTGSASPKQKAKKAAAQNKKKAPVAEKPAPPSKENLDLEMAEYWFKAGKGEDPKLVALNNDMESYWADKKSADAAPSAPATATASPPMSPSTAALLEKKVEGAPETEDAALPLVDVASK